MLKKFSQCFFWHFPLICPLSIRIQLFMITLDSSK